MAILSSVTFLLGVIALSQATSWCTYYNPINPNHSFCLPKLGTAVSAADQEDILDAHNLARSVAGGADMLNMTWDDDLADLAQRWVDTCPGGHEAQNYDRTMFGYYSVGQNWAGSSVQSDWVDMVNLWINERNDYDFSTNTCDVGKVCGHYTQVVWAQTHKVGCAFAACPEETGAKQFQYLCNYGPAGNVNGGSPYLAGGSTPASACQTKVTGKNLCDCGGKTCRNNAKLDVGTCTCQCDGYGAYLGTHTGSECGITNCDQVTEYSQCGVGEGWLAENCKTNGNAWAIYCARTCNVCPSIQGLVQAN